MSLLKEIPASASEGSARSRSNRRVRRRMAMGYRIQTGKRCRFLKKILGGRAEVRGRRIRGE